MKICLLSGLLLTRDLITNYFVLMPEKKRSLHHIDRSCLSSEQTNPYLVLAETRFYLPVRIYLRVGDK